MSALPLNDMRVISSFAEANEVLKSKDIIQGNHTGRIGEPILGGTLMTLEGEPHFERRRMENTLFRRALLVVYEDLFLTPELQARLNRLRSDAGVLVQAELVSLTRTALQVIAAKVIGLEVREEKDIERLCWYAQVFGDAGQVEWIQTRQDEVLSRALVAKQEFIEELYEPAKRDRLALLAQRNEGMLHESELPHDLLMMLVTHGEVEGWDEEQAIRETILYVVGGSITITQSCIHTVWQLLEWLDAHPEDLDRIDDPSFIDRTVNETLRLYPPATALIRRATSDLTLSTGLRIRKGEYVVVDLAASNRDCSFFGEDAGIFDPHRKSVERAKPYGLAFGAGPHMCIGRPLATGLRGTEESQAAPRGVVATVVAEFLAAGIVLDYERPRIMNDATVRHEFVEFPVLFSAL